MGFRQRHWIIPLVIGLAFAWDLALWAPHLNLRFTPWVIECLEFGHRLTILPLALGMIIGHLWWPTYTMSRPPLNRGAWWAANSTKLVSLVALTAIWALVILVLSFVGGLPGSSPE